MIKRTFSKSRKDMILDMFKAPGVQMSCMEICKNIIKAQKLEGSVAHYLSGSISSILNKLVKEGVLQYATEKSVRGGYMYEKFEQLITAANLPDQLMSTLFRSVVDDVTRARSVGIGINMSSWSDTCTVCLGGAAVLGFLPTEKMKEHVKEVEGVIAYDCYSLDGIKFKSDETIRLTEMANMFNYFRKGDISLALRYFNDMTRIPIDEATCNILKQFRLLGNYSGVYDFDSKKIDYLLKDCLLFADLLEQHNC